MKELTKKKLEDLIKVIRKEYNAAQEFKKKAHVNDAFSDAAQEYDALTRKLLSTALSHTQNMEMRAEGCDCRDPIIIRYDPAAKTLMCRTCQRVIPTNIDYSI